ncbi:hypothetical protein MIR68_001619 [Amoeboaphelidium protococcarum]|nr:hypothetical protein MIR68_001619 [Amoeboaphelidium protococcarum]
MTVDKDLLLQYNQQFDLVKNKSNEQMSIKLKLQSYSVILLNMSILQFEQGDLGSSLQLCVKSLELSDSGYSAYNAVSSWRDVISLHLIMKLYSNNQLDGNIIDNCASFKYGKYPKVIVQKCPAIYNAIQGGNMVIDAGNSLDILSILMLNGWNVDLYSRRLFPHLSYKPSLYGCNGLSLFDIKLILILNNFINKGLGNTLSVSLSYQSTQLKSSDDTRQTLLSLLWMYIVSMYSQLPLNNGNKHPELEADQVMSLLYTLNGDQSDIRFIPFYAYVAQYLQKSSEDFSLEIMKYIDCIQSRYQEKEDDLVDSDSLTSRVSRLVKNKPYSMDNVESIKAEILRDQNCNYNKVSSLLQVNEQISKEDSNPPEKQSQSSVKIQSYLEQLRKLKI